MSAMDTGMNMISKMTAVLSLIFVTTFVYAQETVDHEVIAKIREEGFQRSQVMDIAFEMTDLLGPRLTGSRDMQKAQEWAMATMSSMGLTNVNIEPFGPTVASWDNDYTSLHLIEPDYQPLIGYPYAFTPSTDGKLRRDVKIAIIRRPGDFDQYRGELDGAIVLSGPPAELPPRFEADADRFTAEELAEQAGSTLASPFGVGQSEMIWDDDVMSFTVPEDPERVDPL